MRTETNEFEDFSCRTCKLGAPLRKFGTNNEYWDNDMPMYSYDRPAYIFWNGVANYLRDKQCDDAEIRYTLGHKWMRRMLDGDDEEIAELGYQMARKLFQDSKPDIPKDDLFDLTDEYLESQLTASQ